MLSLMALGLVVGMSHATDSDHVIAVCSGSSLWGAELFCSDGDSEFLCRPHLDSVRRFESDRHSSSCERITGRASFASPQSWGFPSYPFAGKLPENSSAPTGANAAQLV